MPKITSVEVQKRNPGRFNIFLDGEFVFGADEDLVVDHRLIPGKILEAHQDFHVRVRHGQDIGPRRSEKEAKKGDQ